MRPLDCALLEEPVPSLVIIPLFGFNRLHPPDAGDNTYGGKYVVNPSGGLISKGHPLGATGLAQCYELREDIHVKNLLSFGHCSNSP